ncbi:MAG: membrane protein insertase YidC [Sutterellaceae bacterium]|nr:membrane protein insertase YidC [Sutterellaceae bacterium]
MGSDFQRTIMWVILAAACFMLWDNWQVYNGKPSFFGAPQVEQTETAQGQSSADVSGVPESSGSGALAVAKGVIQASHPVEVASDMLKLNIDEQGAVVTRAELLKEQQQAEWTDVGLAGMILGNDKPKLHNIVMLNVSPKSVYVAQSGLIGGDFPNHKSMFKHVETKVEVKNDPEQQKDVKFTTAVFESTQGTVTLRKSYELVDGRYGITVRQELVNNGTTAIRPAAYYQLTRDDAKPEGESSFYYTYTGPAIYTSADKFQKIAFDDIGDQPDHMVKSNDGWVAMIQHYFISAWTDVKGETKALPREFYTTKLDQNLYAVGEIQQLGSVEPGQKVSTAAMLYIGPQDQQRLAYMADGLDLVVDYGWLTFLAKPIYSVLYFLYGLVGNWGWSIVLLTCLVKAILYPISAAGYKSMARMKEVTPRMKALQEQYGNDKQRYQQALMELYRKEKINPVGGCLPIVLQIPVFLALYWVLLASVELRGSEWIGWVTDLAMPDPWFILPAVMMATMFAQIKLNPAPADPMQARMMVIMPLVFGVMFFFFASGLVLYWLTNNVLSIAQQWYVNKQIREERERRLNPANSTKK